MSPRPLAVLVVGAGLIGSRRAATAAAHAGTELAGVADVAKDRAAALCAEHGGEAFDDWQAALLDCAPDLVVAATTNKHLLPITLAALEHDAHVLLEKPMGRNLDEARRIAAAAAAAGPQRVCKVGFNHRYHPAVERACTMVRDEALGRLLFARCVYGHGGRPGYENEWRGSLDECGGGELLDQGVHVLDLLGWVLGRPDRVHAEVADFVWPIDPLEDNAFALLRYAGGQVAQMHTSWTQWKNRFELQLYCERGAVEVGGLGKSYGTETLTVARRAMQGGAPAMTTETFDGPDTSWEREWDDLVTAIGSGTQPRSHAAESLGVMEAVDALYRSAAAGAPVALDG